MADLKLYNCRVNIEATVWVEIEAPDDLDEDELNDYLIDEIDFKSKKIQDALEVTDFLAKEAVI